jgi:hypothetical protein
MGRILNINKPSLDMFGRINKSLKGVKDFEYLLGLNVEEIILFDNGSEKLLDEGRVILPRHYFIFVGNKDGELQYKPYEYNEHRIVVTTYNNIITTIDSIG